MVFKKPTLVPVFPDAEFLKKYRAIAAAYDLSLPFSEFNIKPSAVLEHILASPFFMKCIEGALDDSADYYGFCSNEHHRLLGEVNGNLAQQVGHRLEDEKGERYYSTSIDAGLEVVFGYIEVPNGNTQAARMWKLDQSENRFTIELCLTPEEDAAIEAKYNEMDEDAQHDSLSITWITFYKRNGKVDVHISKWNVELLRACKEKYVGILKALKPLVLAKSKLFSSAFDDYVAAIQAS